MVARSIVVQMNSAACRVRKQGDKKRKRDKPVGETRRLVRLREESREQRKERKGQRAESRKQEEKAKAESTAYSANN
jgi:hypothetical protein